jgi:hypothetical protein
MKCDSCITGEARHRRTARVSLPEGHTIEATLDLCEICFAVADQLQSAVMRIARCQVSQTINPPSSPSSC